MSVQRYVLDVTEKKRHTFFMRPVFALLSLCFRVCVSIRHLLYDLGVFRTHSSGIATVSIGNIAVGGTGKTPFVAKLARDLQQYASVGILSRGYRAKCGPNASIRIDHTTDLDPAYCGDEPYMLAHKLKGVPVFVGKNRHKSSLLAKREGRDLLLLDDALQHRKIHRDLDIVLVSRYNLLGKGQFLPLGLLRDHPKRLKKADVVVINHLENTEQFEMCKGVISKFTKAPIIGTEVITEETYLKGRRVGAFAGIAMPEAFFDTLKGLGAEIVCSYALDDHKTFTHKQWEKFQKECDNQGVEEIVCTEKDWIKFPKGLVCHLPRSYVQASLRLLGGSAEYNQLLDHILQLARKHETVD